VCCRLDWTGLDWTGLDWTGLEPHRLQSWTAKEKVRNVLCMFRAGQATAADIATANGLNSEKLDKKSIERRNYLPAIELIPDGITVDNAREEDSYFPR
jgi:hypothetical protein